jgi:hypothetical protein
MARVPLVPAARRALNDIIVRCRGVNVEANTATTSLDHRMVPMSADKLECLLINHD